MDKLKMESKDNVQGNIEKIRELFPNCVTEVLRDGKPTLKVDFDVLKQEMSDTLIDDKEERYQFTWPDKKKSILLANTPIKATLRPCKEESVDFDNTENLYIEGDNLDVLKLLQETYLGKIKMIYIDPPYNTGNDFVYNDDFALKSEEYLGNSGQYDEQGNRLVQNTESNGRFHTDWLNMIYPRLKVAKDLLSDDGIIAVSIDEHEIDNCLKILNEIFGRQNRVGVIVVKSNPRGSMSIGEVANLHEYLVVYCKDFFNVAIIGHNLSEEMVEEYKYEDSNGKYRLLGLRLRGGFWRRQERPNLYFPIYVNPTNGSVSLEKSSIYSEEVLPIQPSTMEDGTWRWSAEKIVENKQYLIGKKVKRGDIEVWDIFQKDYYIREGGRRTKVKSIWDATDINYQNGTIEIRSLFGKNVFDYSKPIYLLRQVIEMIDMENEDIVLDFFSGSATTAHAVMQLNAEDGGNRKFIMVQLPEKCDENSEAFKAGYKNICEIGKERIRRAGKKIVERVEFNKKATITDLTQMLEDDGLLKVGENLKIKNTPDVGFRVLKLDSSNMKDVYYKPSDYTQSLLDSLESNIKEDRTPLDLLFQVMLDLGKPLSAKIEEKEIAGKHVYIVNEDDLIACFDDGITEEVVKEIAKKKPLFAVFRDSGLSSDSTSTNFDQIFATYSPNTTRRVL